MLDFGRDLCTNLQAAGEREWLITNGLGGYASGTIAGPLTRRYHGLLIAALQPPLGQWAGGASEIFDEDPPFTPRGTVSQAWSVAELLRASWETGS